MTRIGATLMPARALLAQLVEHFHGKEGVAGSSPAEGSQNVLLLSRIMDLPNAADAACVFVAAVPPVRDKRCRIAVRMSSPV